MLILIHRRLILLLLIVVSSLSCAENDCDKAAGMCGVSEGLEGECSGAVLNYAECIVAEGSCTPEALVKCAGGTMPKWDGLSPNLDGGVNPQLDIALSTGQVNLTAISLGFAYPNDVALIVELENISFPQPIETRWSNFKLQMNDGTTEMARRDNASQQTTCDGTRKVSVGEKHRCILTFYVSSALEFQKVVYESYENGIRAEAPPPVTACDIGRESGTVACSDGCDNDGNGLTDCDDLECCTEQICQTSNTCQGGCQNGPETTISACSDLCDNDSDTYVDCEDLGCCEVRTDCSLSTTCGKRRADFCSVSGPEDTLSACSDGCDNDQDLHTDCNDSSCCAARTDCSANTYCGK